MSKHLPISVFDMLKIGVGPSSSHTLGPWRAAEAFLAHLNEKKVLPQVEKLVIYLYGSLAKTGVGHGTDIAVLMGFLGEDPVETDTRLIGEKIKQIQTEKTLELGKSSSFESKKIVFDPAIHLLFLKNQSLPAHPNALRFVATLENGKEVSDVFYSIGGGFLKKEGEAEQKQQTQNTTFVYSCDSAEDLLNHCQKNNKKIAELVLENENTLRPFEQTKAGILKIWNTMQMCIFQGCQTQGILPGGLEVKRRAASMSEKMLGKSFTDIKVWKKAIIDAPKDFNSTLNWISCFALAVNEENAAFGRVVTAPTNGSAGVVPAILMYYHLFLDGNTEEKIIDFLCTASEIGSLFKKEATISAAMGGCQAEIGVSSAMAAAALTAALGGKPAQVLQAAEIAMEHHLGMTCDPIGGLVQIPCIERNTMGAAKALVASQLALQQEGSLRVSLDQVIKTMWQTALDMDEKYKETADGGLAVHVPISLSEC